MPSTIARHVLAAAPSPARLAALTLPLTQARIPCSSQCARPRLDVLASTHPCFPYSPAPALSCRGRARHRARAVPRPAAFCHRGRSPPRRPPAPSRRARAPATAPSRQRQPLAYCRACLGHALLHANAAAAHSPAPARARPHLPWPRPPARHHSSRALTGARPLALALAAPSCTPPQ